MIIVLYIVLWDAENLGWEDLQETMNESDRPERRIQLDGHLKK